MHAAAYKSVSDICCDDLKYCGLTLHQRCKQPAADAFLTDIITAFDKLDTADKLPAIFWEANELIRLLNIVPDPVSLILTPSLLMLCQEIPSLIATPLSDSIVRSCSSLEELVGDLKVQLNKFMASISQASDNLSKLLSSVV